MERNFYVLVYDIRSNRRRLKIARLCEAVAERVQYSVFEGYFTTRELEKLLQLVKKHFNPKEDSLRIYRLCDTCRDLVQTQGIGTVSEPPGVRII